MDYIWAKLFLGTELMSVATLSGLSSTISNGSTGTLSGSDFTTLTTKRRKGSPSYLRFGTKSSSKVCLKLNRAGIYWILKSVWPDIVLALHQLVKTKSLILYKLINHELNKMYNCHQLAYFIQEIKRLKWCPVLKWAKVIWTHMVIWVWCASVHAYLSFWSVLRETWWTQFSSQAPS
jgi:hypothetical protein